MSDVKSFTGSIGVVSPSGCTGSIGPSGPSGYDTVVLSGGGLKGFYILGAIQSAIDKGLLNNVKNFVGTSIGAIIGYLLAIGYTPIEILVYIHENNFTEKMDYNLVALGNNSGIISFTPIQEILEKMTLKKIGKFLTLGKLRELGKNLVCCTYNMTVGITEYLDAETYTDLPCLTALRMSSNIPIIFDRFRYMDCAFIDGGITNNFPIDIASKIGEKILGINLEISDKSLQDRVEDGIIGYIMKLLYIPAVHNTKEKIERNKIVGKTDIVTVKLSDVNFLEFTAKPTVKLEMFSLGYASLDEQLRLR